MRKSKEVAAESRKRIVDAASRSLRARGVEGTSVADVMHAAGMTHGGFYKHFTSKDELSALASRAAFQEVVARFDERERSAGRDAARQAYLAEYLSSAHVERPEIGCPVTFCCGEETDAFGENLMRADAAPVPHARVEVLPAMGHFGPLQAPDAVADAVIGAFGDDRDTGSGDTGDGTPSS